MDTSLNEATLTPLRAHYLKKALVSLEFSYELSFLLNSSISPPLSVLSLFGHPFTPLPKDYAQDRDIPFLRFMFRQFVLSFPFLSAAPKGFFPSKLQPFMDSLLSRNLSPDIALFPEEEDAERTGRAKSLAKLEKHMCLLLGSALKLSEAEEVVRLSQKDLDRLEAMASLRLRRSKGKDHIKAFDVNIVCIRTVSERGRVRTKQHEVRSRLLSLGLLSWSLPPVGTKF
jgi:PX-associated